MAGAKDVINIALQQKGISGRPNKFTRWYGVTDEWCAMFVSWCCNQAGISTSIVPRTAAVQGLLDHAKSHGRFKLKNSGYKPAAGDIFIQKSNGASHTGFVVSCSGNNFVSIEGNCGNAVKSCTHSLSEAALTGFFVPAYPESSSDVSFDDVSEQTEKKEITKSAVKSTYGKTGTQQNRLWGFDTGDEAYYDLTIENNEICRPVVSGEPTLTLERKNAPGVLKFTVLKDDVINFREGNPVKFRVNGENVFYGYVFSKSRRDNTSIEVTAYDQLRYFKNKDSYIYENKKYSELLKMIAEDYNLRLGDIADTGYVIPRRVDEGTLFDILGNASDLTVIRTGKLFVLFDDRGKITLKNIEDMQTDILIDASQLQGYEYKTSIDGDTYNRIRLARDNDETGEREFYDFNGTETQNKWGILQLYEKLDGNAGDIQLKGKAMLDFYNKLGRSLRLTNVFGDIRVRGGSSVTVSLDLGDMIVNHRLVVEKVTHKFSGGSHFMDLTLSGLGGEMR